MYVSKPADLLSPKRYDSVHDVKMRLQGTWLKYRDRIIYCLGVNEDLSIRCVDYLSSTELVIHSSDKHLDISTLPVGWINFRNQAPLFTARRPTQSQKQGLCARSLYCWRPSEKGGGQEFTGLDLEMEYGVKDFAECLGGTYPTLRSLLGKEQTSGAFSRDWAIFYRKPGLYGLYHKVQPVGVINTVNHSILFTPGGLSKVRQAQLNQELNVRTKGTVYHVTEFS